MRDRLAVDSGWRGTVVARVWPRDDGACVLWDRRLVGHVLCGRGRWRCVAWAPLVVECRSRAITALHQVIGEDEGRSAGPAQEKGGGGSIRDVRADRIRGIDVNRATGFRRR